MNKKAFDRYPSLMTVEEVAKILHTTHQIVLNKIYTYKINASQLPNRHWRVKKTDVMAYSMKEL